MLKKYLFLRKHFLPGKKTWPQLSVLFIGTDWSPVLCSLWQLCWHPEARVGWVGFHRTSWAPAMHVTLALCIKVLLLPTTPSWSSNLLLLVAEGCKEKGIPRSNEGCLVCVPYFFTRQGWFGVSYTLNPAAPLQKLPGIIFPSCCQLHRDFCKILPVLLQPRISFSYLPWNHGVVSHLF